MDVPYTALARRFRPQTFTEVVGQGRIATTLRNAILDGRVAHAYLFTGARGVGKTSMARIFAKALNCPNAVDAVPCNECEICRSISMGQDVDVSEIDGASNRGIDDIRSLRANVNVRSMRSRFKVYIVDEVHMLTKEAFNALLKTLEEPPPGVKFIFCTTEPNKLPDTILSRCQRFEFGTIATPEIVGRLAELATAEGFQVEQAALELVARRAAGSMRDSQSLFDQLLAFGSENISVADVHRLLGTAPDDRLVALAQCWIDRRADSVLMLLDAALLEGVQLDPLWDQLVAYCRDLMIVATGATGLDPISVGVEQAGILEQQSRTWGLRTILAALEILAETKQRMQRTTLGRSLAELALVRLTLLRDFESLDLLIAELKGTAPPAGRPAMPAASRQIAASPLTSVKAPAVSSSGGKLPAEMESPPRSAMGELQATPPIAASQDVRSIPGKVPFQEHSLLGEPAQDAAPASMEMVTTGMSQGGPAIEDGAAEVEWGLQCGPALLAALQKQFQDVTGTHLRQIVSTAIVGPNQVEFSFPISYDLSRRACERAEVLSKIESTASRLTKREVRVRLRSIEHAARPHVKPTSPGPSVISRQKTVSEPADPLAAEVGRIFGIETWCQQDLGPVALEPDENEEG